MSTYERKMECKFNRLSAIILSRLSKHEFKQKHTQYICFMKM